MINLVIFSKNRACQLHLLLESIQKNAMHLFSPNGTFVIYRHTSEEFKKGYDKLRLSGLFNGINFIEQTHFQSDTIDVLKNMSHYYPYTCFMVDDNIVYRKIPIQYSHIDNLFKNKEVGTISLRLGENIEYDDWYNRKTAIKPEQFGVMEFTKDSWSVDFRETVFEVILWDWSQLHPHCNFGYPFSVDGNIYRTKQVLDGLDYEFDNPNALEGRFDRNKLPKIMCCLEQSVLVNNPLNLVGSSNNNAGLYFKHTLEDLNTAYLNDHKISLSSIIKHNMIACHQEMNLNFEKI